MAKPASRRRPAKIGRAACPIVLYTIGFKRAKLERFHTGKWLKPRWARYAKTTVTAADAERPQSAHFSIDDPSALWYTENRGMQRRIRHRQLPPPTSARAMRKQARKEKHLLIQATISVVSDSGNAYIRRQEASLSERIDGSLNQQDPASILVLSAGGDNQRGCWEIPTMPLLNALRPRPRIPRDAPARKTKW